MNPARRAGPGSGRLRLFSAAVDWAQAAALGMTRVGAHPQLSVEEAGLPVRWLAAGGH